MRVPVPDSYHLERTLTGWRMGRYDPTLMLSGGRARFASPTPLGPGALELHREADAIRVERFGPGADWLTERIEAILGLEDDPSRFPSSHPEGGVAVAVERLRRRFSGMHLPRAPVVLTRLLQVVLLQLVTSREAILAWRKLVSKLGDPAPGLDDLIVPPTVSAILRTPDYELVSFGIRPRQARTLRTVARYAERIEATARAGRGDLAKLLEGLPGVGPWTVQYVLGSALADADAVLLGDYNLPSTLAFVLAGEARADDARMLELLEPYRGHRFRVIRLIWMNGVHAPRRGPRL